MDIGVEENDPIYVPEEAPATTELPWETPFEAPAVPVEAPAV